MKPIVYSLLYLAVLFSLSTFVFDPANLYSDVWWLDIPMHVLGGFGVASLAAAVFSYKKSRISYKKIIIAYLIVAVMWELYEVIHDFIVLREWGGWVDTISDVCNGFVGATISYLLIKK
jgi:hypothetical protein